MTHKAVQLRAHAGQPAESWWMNMLRQWKPYHWVGWSSPRHLLTVPTVWLPADSDDPPTILRLMMSHKHIHPKGGVKRFILYIIEGSSEASQAGPEWLETARKGGWTGFLLWLGLGLMGESPHTGRGLCGSNLPVSPKGAPRLSYQFPQMWAQRKEGGWDLNTDSYQTSKNGPRLLIMPCEKYVLQGAGLCKSTAKGRERWEVKERGR